MSGHKWENIRLMSDKLMVLTKFEALLHKIYFKYKNVIDSEYKDEYNQLCREYNRVFHPKSKHSRPDRPVERQTTAVQSLTPVKPKLQSIAKLPDKSDLNSTEATNVEVKSTLNPKIKLIVIKKGSESEVFDPKEVDKMYLTAGVRSDNSNNKSDQTLSSNSEMIQLMVNLDQHSTKDEHQTVGEEHSDQSAIKSVATINGNPRAETDDQTAAPLRPHRKMQWKKINTTSVMNKYYNPQTKTFDCPFEWCDRRVYPDKEKLRFHLYNIHTDKQLPCPFEGCGKLFKNKDRLRSHQMIHTNAYPVHCEYPECDYKCRSNFALRDHIQRVHQTGQQFQCLYYKCGRVFNSEAYLRRHEKCHSSEPMFRCKVLGCGQRFHTPTQLTKHKVSDHNQLIACEWPGCDYRHHSKFVIKEHRRVHTGEKPFRCQWTDCQKAFRTKVNLKLHLKVHQKNSKAND